jgi:hypothetical protein
MKTKCKCGKYLYKGDTYEKNGEDFCSVECMKSTHPTSESTHKKPNLHKGIHKIGKHGAFCVEVRKGNKIFRKCLECGKIVK